MDEEEVTDEERDLCISCAVAMAAMVMTGEDVTAAEAEMHDRWPDDVPVEVFDVAWQAVLATSLGAGIEADYLMGLAINLMAQ